MSSQNLHDYLSGRTNPGNEVQDKLRALGCNIEWLMTGKSAERKSDIDQLPIELMHIPVYESVSAGKKHSVVAERAIDYIAVPKSKDDSQFGVKVRGKSMEPKVNEGVIVSRKAEPKSGDLCLVSYGDGDYCLRYVHFKPAGVMLTSENSKEYPPEIVPKQKIHSIFRVVRLLKEF